MVTKKQIIDCIYGFAVADALGVPYEFKHRRAMQARPCVGMAEYGTHDQPIGTWSDDTSMTLASLEGLAELDGISELAPVMDKFAAWLNDDAYTVDGLFDIGGTCSRAISRYINGRPLAECGCADERDNGNGSLMRMLPAAIYSINMLGGIDSDFIGRMSALTHAHEISRVACDIYARVVFGVLNGESVEFCAKTAVECADINKLGAFNRLRERGFFDLPPSEIKSSGYVADTLEAALWCVRNTSTYRDCALTAVNLGDDTDTVAAVACGLAGLIYGTESIPAEWLGVLRGKDVIDKAIDKFCKKVGAL